MKQKPKPGKDVNPRMSESETVQRCGWPECRAACCVYGTWIDKKQMDIILAQPEIIQNYLPSDRQDSEKWFGKEIEADVHVPGGMVYHTAVVDDPEHYGGTACVFMRTDYRCALQVAGEEAGLHPWHFKPFYCILHPLDLDDQGRITLDEIRNMVIEPASCLRHSERKVTLRGLFAEEIEYLSKLS